MKTRYIGVRKSIEVSNLDFPPVKLVGLREEWDEVPGVQYAGGSIQPLGVITTDGALRNFGLQKDPQLHQEICSLLKGGVKVIRHDRG